MEIITLLRHSGLGIEEGAGIFGIKARRIYGWIKKLKEGGFNGLEDRPAIADTMTTKITLEEEAAIEEIAYKYDRENHRNLAHRLYRDKGIFVSESTVYRVMKRKGLIRERGSRERDSGKEYQAKPRCANKIWHTDISYINCGYTDDGRKKSEYLISVMDGYSRYIIYWDLYRTMSADNCRDAVANAMVLAQPNGVKTKIITDNGGQYRARKTTEFFKEELGLGHIFTRVRHPETNGKIERWFKTVKSEALERNEYEDEYEAREVIMEFVDYYNRERLHQGIGYLTPEEKYYGLNNDYALRRQKAKEVTKIKRMEFWGKRALSYI